MSDSVDHCLRLNKCEMGLKMGNIIIAFFTVAHCLLCSDQLFSGAEASRADVQQKCVLRIREKHLWHCTE